MDGQPEKELLLWTRQYIMLIIMGSMTSICFFMIQPCITKYVTEMGAAISVGGMIAGLFSITALIARPFSGLIADRINRKILLIIEVYGASSHGYSIIFTCYSFVFLLCILGYMFYLKRERSKIIVAQNVYVK